MDACVEGGVMVWQAGWWQCSLWVEGRKQIGLRITLWSGKAFVIDPDPAVAISSSTHLLSK
jgi:hypothetical protein